MKRLSVFITALLLLLVLSACGNSSEAESSVYSFSGQNDAFEISDGVIIRSDKENVFEGGKIRAVSKSDLENIKSFRAEFYTVKDGERTTVLIDEVVNESADPLEIQADDLGKISSEDPSLVSNITEENTELFCEVKILYRHGGKKTSVIELTIKKITD